MLCFSVAGKSILVHLANWYYTTRTVTTMPKISYLKKETSVRKNVEPFTETQVRHYLSYIASLTDHVCDKFIDSIWALPIAPTTRYYSWAVAIAGLQLMSQQPYLWTRTKRFLRWDLYSFIMQILRTKVFFSTNMAAWFCHAVASKEWTVNETEGIFLYFFF